MIELYVARQWQRHPMADLGVQQRLAELQVAQPDVDLSKIRSTAHGQFIYNLHLVVEHQDPRGDCSDEFLQRTVRMIQGVAAKREFRLKGAGIVANHLHLAVGCGIKQAPSEVALCFLNNLAFVHGMQPIYRFGYYTGTFGNFDLGAVWNAKYGAML